MAGLFHYYRMGLSFSQALVRIATISVSELCAEFQEENRPEIRLLIGGLDSVKEETRANVELGLRNDLIPIISEEKLLHFFRGARESDRVFSWKDLDDSAVFIRVPEEKVEAWGAGVILLLTMLFRQLQHRPEAHTAAGKEVQPCLVAIDELPRFGMLPMLKPELATLRSKKVNILLAVQSLSQLGAVYGDANQSAILDCCQYRAIFRVADPKNQRLIADMIGTCVRPAPSIGASYDPWGNPIGFSYQMGVQRDYIVQPGDLASLQGVVVATPCGSYCLNKIPPFPRADNELDVQQPENCVDAASGVVPRTIEERAEDARRIIEAHRWGMPQNRDLECRNPGASLGGTLLAYFPELLEATDQQEFERAVRVLAADQRLIRELREKASRLAD